MLVMNNNSINSSYNYQKILNYELNEVKTLKYDDYSKDSTHKKFEKSKKINFNFLKKFLKIKFIAILQDMKQKNLKLTL